MTRCSLCGKTAFEDGSSLCSGCSEHYSPLEMIILYPKKLILKSKCEHCNELALCVKICFNELEEGKRDATVFTDLCGKCLLNLRKKFEKNAPNLLPESQLDKLSEAIREISLQEISYT